MLRTILLLSTVGLLGGCGALSGDPPNPQDFDGSCDVADDCVAVVWQACGCDCASLYALSAAGAEAFVAEQSDYDFGRKKCEKDCDLGCYPIGPASEAPVACVEGTCDVDPYFGPSTSGPTTP